jgi:hypothetical protein
MDFLKISAAFAPRSRLSIFPCYHFCVRSLLFLCIYPVSRIDVDINRSPLAGSVTCNAERISSCGHIWPSAKFCNWLTSQGLGSLWKCHVLPQMKHIATSTLVCCQPHLRPRPNSGQIYGYDFLVDASFGVWLLEINSSPTMEYSTPVTADLCAQVQEDTLKVRRNIKTKNWGCYVGTAYGANKCACSRSRPPQTAALHSATVLREAP